MSTQPDNSRIPPWTKGDRMRNALRHSDLGVQEMADYLDVSRSTVSTWLNDRIEPSTQTMRLWALRTGVPLEWLLTGTPGDTRPSNAVTGQYSPARPSRLTLAAAA